MTEIEKAWAATGGDPEKVVKGSDMSDADMLALYTDCVRLDANPQTIECLRYELLERMMRGRLVG